MSLLLQYLYLLAFVLTSNAKAIAKDGELVAVIQVFRHGQRTPVFHYPNDPYSDISYWPAARGQLVNEGKQQHYALGQFTKNRYESFLSTQYNSSEFYAQTTDIDRTHMSAQSNLAALFEPKGDQIWRSSLSWQPIPIHPADSDVLTQECSTVNQLVNDVVTNEPLFAEINEEYADVYKVIAEGSGSSVTSVMSTWLIRDTLFIEELNNFDLPAWTKPVYPEPMGTLAAYSFLANSYTDDLKKINTGLFYRDLVDHFEKMLTNPTSSYKFKMYSAHDTNIAALLNTIGAFVPHSPYYASSIYYELRKKNGKGFVNIWHKDQEDFRQITVQGCTLSCSLTMFKTLMAKYIINEDQLDSLCNPAKTVDSKVATFGLEIIDPVSDDVNFFLNQRRPKSQHFRILNSTAYLSN